MTYATCKAIAFSLFTMAFLLSASSLILFIDDQSVQESQQVVEIAHDTSDAIEGIQIAGTIPMAEQILKEELSVSGSSAALK